MVMASLLQGFTLAFEKYGSFPDKDVEFFFSNKSRNFMDSRGWGGGGYFMHSVNFLVI